MSENQMSEDELLSRIQGLSPELAKRVICALAGHSRIQTSCFGYFYCGRCEDQVGDNLAGVYDAKGVVIVGHNCPTCRENSTNLTWRDTLMAPEPFVGAAA